MNEAVAPPGWQAILTLEYGLRGRKTRLLKKRQRGPLALQRAFYPEGNTCHNYLLHPPGGVVGGDTLDITVGMQTGSHTLITTPGANKFYRSKGSRKARVKQAVTVADGAILEWLPQHNIFFPGANVAINSQVDIARGGRYAGWEMHCFGRPANEETFSNGEIHSQTRVSIDGELRLVEQLNTLGMTTLSAPTGLRGLPMQGSFIAAPCTQVHLDALERILQSQLEQCYPLPIGITLVDEVLVVRALGEQAEPMLAVFTLLWSELRQLWLGSAASVPRIWAT